MARGPALAPTCFERAPQCSCLTCGMGAQPSPCLKEERRGPGLLESSGSGRWQRLPGERPVPCWAAGLLRPPSRLGPHEDQSTERGSLALLIWARPKSGRDQPPLGSGSPRPHALRPKPSTLGDLLSLPAKFMEALPGTPFWLVEVTPRVSA